MIDVNKPLSSILISNIIWTRYDKNSFSFQTKGMDKNIHFTISYHENDPYVNLHITKNVKGTQTNKPKITLVKAEKGMVEEILEIVGRAFLSKMLKPIDFTHFSRQARKRMRILFLDDRGNQLNDNSIEKKLIEFYHHHSKIKNGKLQISEQIIKEITDFANSKNESQQIKNQLRLVNLKRENRIEDFLNAFMKPELVSTLMINGLNAISIIKEAKSYEDTRLHDNPIVLFV